MARRPSFVQVATRTPADELLIEAFRQSAKDCWRQLFPTKTARSGVSSLRAMFKKTLSNVVALFSISDEQAMWRVRMEDDHQAFALLMERWHDRIHALCARMVGSIHTAEDLAQEVFARIFQK